MYVVYLTPIAEQFLNVLGHEKLTLRLTIFLMTTRILLIIVFFTYNLTVTELLYLFLLIAVYHIRTECLKDGKVTFVNVESD